jgi:hypothetical protein
MWTLLRRVLGLVCACALSSGCVFDSSGLSPRDMLQQDTSRDRATDAPRPDTDGAWADGRRLEASTDGQRDQLLHDQPVKDLPVKDRPPAKDVTPPDKTLPDKTLPDKTVKPDTGGCLVEDFTSGLGQVQSKSGQWALSNGALRQSQTGAGNYAVIAGVTASNYVVSALITVNSLFSKPTSGWVIGAALGVRVQSGTQTPEQWLCGIYPGSSALVVVHCTGGDPSTTCFIQTQAGPTIAVGQQVRVRAKMVGPVLTCDLPQLGGTITRNTGLSSGGPTLITQFVDASYDDLSVCPP